MIKREIKLQCWHRFKFRPANRNYCSLLSSDFHHQNLISLLQSCDRIPQTAQAHALMLKTGLDRIPFPLSKLIAQICLHDINYADSIFKRIENPNLYMFNAMLRGHSVGGDPRNGLVLFNRMRSENLGGDFGFDQFTFVSVLKSCSRLVEVRAGVGVHTIVVKSGFDLVLNVTNALLHFYCVCGRMNDARQVFDEMRLRKDLVSWNSLMGGYLSVNEYALILDLFKLLLRESFGFSATTILNVISAAAQLNASLGESVHLLTFKIGFLTNLKVVSALISMYGKQGLIDSARRIFDEVDVKRDVVLWNSLIDGYAKAGVLEEALGMVRLMKDLDVKPNSSTLAGLLSSCSASWALSIGEYVHDYIDEHQLPMDAVLGTAIIDMYAKSGLLEKAIEVFDKLEFKDVKTWTAMISGFGTHGQGDNAIKLFRQMEEEGEIRPNEVTFLNVLNACSHGGLVAEGVMAFKRMIRVYKLKPGAEHYGCMIDLLGRAGMLGEAHQLIKGLVAERDATAWRALLGACRVYGDVELAERVKGELEGMDEDHPADLLSVAGAYAAAGMVRDGRFDLESKHGVKVAGYTKIGL